MAVKFDEIQKKKYVYEMIHRLNVCDVPIAQKKIVYLMRREKKFMMSVRRGIIAVNVILHR